MPSPEAKKSLIKHKIQTLVLIGGGHAHALVLKEFLRVTDKDFHLILVSDSARSPYSGMLTGQIAGIYQENEINIDVQKLVLANGGKFILAAVDGIDFLSKSVSTVQGHLISYDVLSINCGGRPNPKNISGADRHALGVKPTHQFQLELDRFLTRVSPGKIARVVQIGGGVAGVECSTGYCRRLENLKIKSEITLIDSSPVFLKSHNRFVRSAVSKMLNSLNIRIWSHETVQEIKAGELITESGRKLSFDFAVIATPAEPEAWVKALNLEHYGNFVRVDKFLETTEKKVFAAGDVAQNPDSPVPRAGVFAVREAPVLSHNLLAAMRGEKFVEFKPQKNYLSLIMDGHGKAIASRGWFYFPRSRLMGWLKDRIDRGFVRKLNLN